MFYNKNYLFSCNYSNKNKLSSFNSEMLRFAHQRPTGGAFCLGRAPSGGRCTAHQSVRTTDRASCGWGHHGIRQTGGQMEYGKTSAGYQQTVGQMVWELR